MNKGAFKGNIPKTATGRAVLAIIRANPDKMILELHAMIKVDHPKFTEQALRMMIHHYDLPFVKKVRERKKVKGPTYAGKPVAEATPAMALGPLHTPVQSYHGRSRYLPAYYEL